MITTAMRRWGRLLTALACVTWLTPAVHGEPITRPQAAPTIWDVRLDHEASFSGRLVNLDGQAVSDQQIELVHDGQPVTETVSDRDGHFQFRNVPAGLHQLRFGSYGVVCRVWTDRAAPPSAVSQLTVLSAPLTIRGQQPIQEIFRNPLVIGLIVAAAVAIPLAVNDSEDGS